MEVLSPSAAAISTTPNFSIKPRRPQPQSQLSSNPTIKLPSLSKPKKISASNSSSFCVCKSWPITAATSPPSSFSSSIASSSSSSSSTANDLKRWIVIVEKPQGLNSKPDIIKFYVKTLERVLGSERDAQMRVYDASWVTHFGFCCELDENASKELARLPGVVSVEPDPDFQGVNKDYSLSGQLSNSNSCIESTCLFPSGTSKHWLVRMDKPRVGVVTKAQMVDFYAQILTKVLGNEKDAQMCIYHVSWQSNFGFCCELDEECARELTGVPAVLSVQPDENFESSYKDYGGHNLLNSSDSLCSSVSSQSKNIRTKKLFVTGLSFYTSEKTLRAAFEGYGELVEVKIIMDKISKRSKGYAFIEFTTEEAASAALKEMNGKIINGWMIVVDVAKSNPPKYSRGRLRPAI